MNSEKLLDAIGLLDDRYLETERKTPVIPWRRRLIAFAAAVLMLILSVGTAMAVSEEFREAVFRFFLVEQDVIVPTSPVESEISADNMIVEPTVSITGSPLEGSGVYDTRSVTGVYVHTPVATLARDDVFLVCSDEVSMKSGNHYDAYYVENGVFEQLQERSFDHIYEIRGDRIRVCFDWVEYKGKAHLTYVDPEAPFRFFGEQPSAEAMLACLKLPDGGCPVLINLYTGEMTDLLAGTEAEQLPNLDMMAISRDHTKLLMHQEDLKESFLYYLDLVTGAVYKIDELAGERVDACALTEKKLICWSITEHPFGADEYRIWHIDLTSFQKTELFDGVRNAAQTKTEDAGVVFLEGFDGRSHWGNNYTGSPFAVAVDEEQNGYVIDLETGETSKLEGLVWQQGMSRIPSSDGRKLLMTCREEGRPDIGFIAVLDFEEETVLQFHRENNGGVSESAYWFSADTVVVCTAVYGTSLSADYYLYQLSGTR